MERRGFLGTYKIQNVSGEDIELRITLHNGTVVEKKLLSEAIVHGVRRSGLNLLSHWISIGDVKVEKEYKYCDDWKIEGF